MRYADTCLLVSLFVRDAGTLVALAWLKSAGADPIMASHWGVTEFAGAAGQKARTGQITPELHRKVTAKFRRFASRRLAVESPEAADFERAAELLEHFNTSLRAGDALHLAICARRGATLCTADQPFADAAAAFDIKVEKVG